MTDLVARRRERRRGLAALAVGLVTSLTTMAAVASGTLGAFQSKLDHTKDSAATGTLVIQELETGGKLLCDSYEAAGRSIDADTGTCATDLYGGLLAMAPLSSNTVTYVFKNAGTTPAKSFTISPGLCQPSANGTISGSGNLCDWVQVTITSGTTPIYDGTATALGGTPTLDVLAKLYPAASPTTATTTSGTATTTSATPTSTTTTTSTTTPATTGTSATTTASATPTAVVSPDGTIPLTFTVRVADTADAAKRNTYQGLKLLQTLSFTMTA